jgi:hypothetical protein
VALRHERRPGTANANNPEALKGRNNVSDDCAALSGLESGFELETQGVACGLRRVALPWADLFGPFGAKSRSAHFKIRNLGGGGSSQDCDSVNGNYSHLFLRIQNNIPPTTLKAMNQKKR